MLSKNKKSKTLLAGIVLCFFLLLAFEIWKNCTGESGAQENYVHSLITAAIGSALFLLVIIYSSYSRVLRVNIRALPRHILFALPCFAVAINNFPILPFLFGKAYVAVKGADILLYFLVCLGTGLFEELVFRGYILMMLLEKKRSNKKEIFAAVFASSAIFGLIHLVNIFAGADPFSTVLQVGYSFLIGGMCAIVLIKTGSVWYPALIHAIYNFAGGVIPRFGGGTVWDVPTITITAVLAVLVAVYLIAALIRTDAKTMAL